MKPNHILSLLLVVTSLLLFSCGYHNPYIYKGPEKKVYLAEWKNRTSELQLNAKLNRNLIQWFHKNKAIKLVDNKKDADFILGGEIVSIDLPSLSHRDSTSTKVKIYLTDSYIMKDLHEDKVAFKVSRQLRTKSYSTSGSSSSSTANEDAALEEILDELSQEIYSKFISSISKD